MAKATKTVKASIHIKWPLWGRSARDKVITAGMLREIVADLDRLKVDDEAEIKQERNTFGEGAKELQYLTWSSESLVATEIL